LPRNLLERTIAQIWGDVLGHETVDVHEHFYDLGGESLQALRIMAKIRQTLNVQVDLQSLIDAPTVAEMALHVAKHMEAGTNAPEDNQPRETANATGNDGKGSGSYRLNRTSAILFALCPFSL
ncbi:MAG TPA: phosphopantetheine-binding protein, partial [Candidatus Binatia bacterium]|nr:phosphopantetheine-binding protein [Candidatus Binatia bacterium]